MTQLEALQNQFTRALKRLREVLHQKKTTVVRDSAIKRFELSFDLCWKLIKEVLQKRKGVICHSPKDCFREAYRQKLVEGFEDFWMEVTDWRNSAVHTYKEELAEDLYKKLPKVLERFQQLWEKLKEK